MNAHGLAHHPRIPLDMASRLLRVCYPPSFAAIPIAYGVRVVHIGCWLPRLGARRRRRWWFKGWLADDGNLWFFRLTAGRFVLLQGYPQHHLVTDAARCHADVHVLLSKFTSRHESTPERALYHLCETTEVMLRQLVPPAEDPALLGAINHLLGAIWMERTMRRVCHDRSTIFALETFMVIHIDSVTLNATLDTSYIPAWALSFVMRQLPEFEFFVAQRTPVGSIWALRVMHIYFLILDDDSTFIFTWSRSVGTHWWV